MRSTFIKSMGRSSTSYMRLTWLANSMTRLDRIDLVVMPFFSLFNFLRLFFSSFSCSSSVATAASSFA